MFCYCQLPLELSLSQQSIPVFFIHKFLLMESSIYRKRGKRIEQNIYWMVPSSEIAQACNFFIQFQITYQLNTGPIALYTKEINWTLILYLASPRYRISLNCFVEIINIVFIFISYHSTGRGKSKFCGIQTILYWRKQSGKLENTYLSILYYSVIFFRKRLDKGIRQKVITSLIRDLSSAVIRDRDTPWRTMAPAALMSVLDIWTRKLNQSSRREECLADNCSHWLHFERQGRKGYMQ